MAHVTGRLMRFAAHREARCELSLLTMLCCCDSVSESSESVSSVSSSVSSSESASVSSSIPSSEVSEPSEESSVPSSEPDDGGSDEFPCPGFCVYTWQGAPNDPNGFWLLGLVDCNDDGVADSPPPDPIPPGFCLCGPEPNRLGTRFLEAVLVPCEIST